VGFLEDVAAVREEQRILGSVPWMPWNDSRVRFDTGGPAHPSRAYASAESAMALPALYAGTSLLASYAASLPLQTFTRYTGADGTPGRRLWTGPSLLDKPALTGSPFDWVFAAMVSAILQGNAWGYITGKDGYGFPTGVEWIPAEDVFVQEAMDQRSANPLDAKVYVYGKQTQWYGPDAELFHVKGFSLPGRLQGLSLLMHAGLTITAGMEAQRYGTTWYEAGGFPTGTFQNSEIEINKEQAAEMRHELLKSLRAHQPLVYGRDWDYKPVTVPPSEAQFIDAMQLNATHIAAMLNLPANRVGGTTGDSLHYSSQMQDALQILESLRPWLVRFEQAFSTIIPKQREAVFHRNAMLSTDLQTRMQIYQIKRDIGFQSINELRAEEDLAPITGGPGDENLPLQLMVAMGTRAGAIPKSLLKSVVLEMDIATDRLIKLEKTYISQGKLPQAIAPAPGAGPGGPGGSTGGPNSSTSGSSGGSSAPAGPTQSDPPPSGTAAIGKPNAPLPLAQDPASFLASLISVQRSMTADPSDREAARHLLARIRERADKIEAAEPGTGSVDVTDMSAPWINYKGAKDILGS
jgi:HK97 family phage portal protein